MLTCDYKNEDVHLSLFGLEINDGRLLFGYVLFIYIILMRNSKSRLAYEMC